MRIIGEFLEAGGSRVSHGCREHRRECALQNFVEGGVLESIHWRSIWGAPKKMENILLILAL